MGILVKEYMTKVKTPAKAAEQALDTVYNSPLLKWNKDTAFVGVKMGTCVVYTPCSHIKPDSQKLFRDKLQEIYKISKNIT